jgi:hypothetical protein
MDRKTVLTTLSFMILGVTLAVAPVRSQISDKDMDIDQDAMSIQKNTAFLPKTQRHSVTSDIGYDAVQDSGQTIEFGSVRNMKVLRPNQARFDVQDRDGSKSGFLFDGKVISIFSANEKVYAVYYVLAHGLRSRGGRS